MDKYPLYRAGAAGYNGTGKETQYVGSIIYPLPRSKGKGGEGEMITPKDKIGYIRRATVDGKEQFKFIEAKIKSVRVGKKQTSVYTDKFYALDAEEIEFNTEMIGKGRGIMLVNEPFITNNEYSEHCRKTVDYWNIHGARSILDGTLQNDEVRE